MSQCISVEDGGSNDGGIILNSTYVHTVTLLKGQAQR